MKNYTVQGVLLSLGRKGCYMHSIMGKRVLIVPDDHEMGNGSWGKVHFLINGNQPYCAGWVYAHHLRSGGRSWLRFLN